VYIENPDKEIILNGKETKEAYQIHPNKGAKLSLQTQKLYIDSFDTTSFLAPLDNGGDYINFANFVVDNNNRTILSEYINYLLRKNKTFKNTNR